MSLADRLKLLRGSLTQKDFGARIGVEQSTVTNWETKNKIPNGDKLERIHTEFGVNINWLLTGEGDRSINKGIEARERGHPDMATEGRAAHKARPPETADGNGLWGRTRHHKVDGRTIPVTLYEPAGGNQVDPFVEAVTLLKEIYDSEDPYYIPALRANLHAFRRAIRRERQISEQDEEIRELRDECDELKKRLAALEERFAGPPPQGEREGRPEDELKKSTAT